MEASHCAVRHVGPELGGRRGWRRACAVAAAAGVLGGAALSGLVSTKSLEAGTVAASVVGSSSADHPTPQLAAAAGRPSPPAVPKGWVATWDGLARRYYFYNQQTKETRSNHKPQKQSTHTTHLRQPSIPASHTHTHTHPHTQLGSSGDDTCAERTLDLSVVACACACARLGASPTHHPHEARQLKGHTLCQR